MRAVTHDRYTDAEGLTLGEVPVPEPGADRIRIRVEAAALNPFDWHLYRGEPWIMRLQQGLRVRGPRGVGADVAGVVEAVGEDVDRFRVGDRVFGTIGRGALAEAAVARPAALAAVPDGVSSDDAAAAAMAGVTALQALRDTARLEAGERVLVWGASGGVGHLAVQLARVLGAGSVDAVCSGRNADLVRGLGADEVYDYTTSAAPVGPYDVVLDTVGTASISRLKGLLAPEGRVVLVGALGGGRLLGPLGGTLRRGIGARLRGVDHRGMLATVRGGDLALLGGWLADGSLVPAVQQTFGLDGAIEALRMLEAGHVAGKLVVRPRAGE
ncbi:NAD(P)-dependent alcohol dehydrogenase [Microbacter sp. GSS18]|nr:NAD(P)-dependent alcohol dehydrogenase [Microbacter sp. GSS18]